MSSERDDQSKQRLKQRLRIMRGICAQAVESCNADAVVLLLSFHDSAESSVRMATFGNQILCKEMVDAAQRRIKRYERETRDEDEGQ